MRWIVYVDLDAFYVSAELRERPELVRKPVIVGPDPKLGPSRGVVLSASYEARQLGVHSAQPAVQAARLAPEAVWIRADFSKYERASREVRELVRKRVGEITVFSIDEAAFSVEAPDAATVERTARSIQSELRERLGLPSSFGAAPYLIVAKIATDRAKPAGVRVVPPGDVAAFLAPLPVRAIPGVGPKTAAVLSAAGIERIGDLAAGVSERLRGQLGGFSAELVALARGELHDRELPRDRGPRSRSTDRTFADDVERLDELESALVEMANDLGNSLEREHIRFQTVSVALRWRDFTRTQRSRTLPTLVTGAAPLVQVAPALLAELWNAPPEGKGRAVRTLSLRTERLREDAGTQRSLDDFRGAERPPAGPTVL